MRETSDRGDNIVLVGFMGAGKSTVARELQRLAGYRLIDLDQAIAEECGRSIPAIFAAEGESCFRDLETRALERLQDAGQAVVATGGGIVGRAENWPLMRRLGTIVFLDCPWETLRRRLAATSGRPLAQDQDWERIEDLWHRRLPLYRQADLVVAGGRRNPPQVAQEILRRLGKERT